MMKVRHLEVDAREVVSTESEDKRETMPNFSVRRR